VFRTIATRLLRRHDIVAIIVLFVLHLGSFSIENSCMVLSSSAPAPEHGARSFRSQWLVSPTQERRLDHFDGIALLHQACEVIVLGQREGAWTWR
jgi:hypothetical protein